LVTFTYICFMFKNCASCAIAYIFMSFKRISKYQVHLCKVRVIVLCKVERKSLISLYEIYTS
jgi:hypothetical protein